MTELTDIAKKGGKNMKMLGIITIILGLMAMLAPMLTGFSIFVMVGVIVVMSGLVRMYWAFQAGSLGKGILTFAIGGLTLLCGIALLANPMFAAAVMTMILAFYLFLDGAFEISAALKRKPEAGWGWLMFGGVVSILLGFMIWRQFPLSGMWAIGIFLGVKLLFIGMSILNIGSTVSTVAKENS